ncbi:MULTISPECIES: YcxB family protein [Rhizobium]|uniref:YcxB family protein n=1 Tax=Rhizobium TaxID=379 RepID=UPI000B85133C
MRFQYPGKFTFRDKGFDVVSDLGSATIPWSTVTEIWERPAHRMIFTAPSQFLTLPVEMLSATDRDFLRSKVPAIR